MMQDILTEPIFYLRAVHFAATLSVSGAVFFVLFIAAPALRKAPGDDALRVALYRRLARLGFTALALAVASGAAWLLANAAIMSGETVSETLSDGTLWIVVAETMFGNDWLARLVLACLLGAVMAPLFSPGRNTSLWLRIAAVVLAAAFAGSLAFAGHAAAGLGSAAIVHPAADTLHLIAAAAWAGTLFPLALLLQAAGRDGASLALAQAATLRFSSLGVASVATLLFTGAINAWYLAGGIDALTETDYGRLLLAKVALFAIMVAIAAINRFALTPRLVQGAERDARVRALNRLRLNAVIEVAIGAAIILIVAVLGRTPPGLHREHPAHMHQVMTTSAERTALP